MERKRFNIIPFKIPFWLPLFHPKYLWKMPKTKEKTIYLTFDDGPIPEVTDFVLSTLNKYDAKATFFCIGDNIRKHPEVFDKVIKNGHTIGNHTFNHLKGNKTKTAEYIENISLCDEQILKHSVSASFLFRPPYGRIKGSQADKVSETKKIVMWDVLSQDYDQRLSKEQCSQKTIKATKDGSIVVFHDSIKAAKNMKYALPILLNYYTEQGFSFKAIPNNLNHFSY